jgi:hypothetical protein
MNMFSGTFETPPRIFRCATQIIHSRKHFTIYNRNKKYMETEILETERMWWTKTAAVLTQQK